MTDAPALSRDDRADVVETCVRFAWCLDDRRWDDLAALFGSDVRVDYSDLFGGAAATLAPHQLVSASRHLLETLDTTQHFVGGHLVTGGGNRATCRTQVIATHTYAAARLGERIWTAAGSYTMDLERAASGASAWLIVGLRFTLAWSTGNHEIVHQSRVDATATTSR